MNTRALGVALTAASLILVLFVAATGPLRSFFGDVVVVVFLVAALASLNIGSPRGRVIGVALFAVAVELSQGLNLVGPDAHWLLHLTVGSTTDPVDLLAYGFGLVASVGAERGWAVGGPALAAQRVVSFLRREHANERGAALAYRGHARSVRDADEARHIAQIEAEEWHHRELLGRLLAELGATPAWFEAPLGAVGWTLGKLCHVTGWLLPMLGAGWIERRNAGEYFQAAIDARAAGLPELARTMVELGSVEVEHHAWFSARVRSHWLGARLPLRPVLEIPPLA